MCRFFFFNDTATTEIYTLSLHDALPICVVEFANKGLAVFGRLRRDEDAKLSTVPIRLLALSRRRRSAEHTSELQSLRHLVCRRLLDDRHIAIRLAVCPQPRHRSPYFGSR